MKDPGKGLDLFAVRLVKKKLYMLINVKVMTGNDNYNTQWIKLIQIM